MRRPAVPFALAVLAVAAFAGLRPSPADAQPAGVTLPPSGDNQRSRVTQQLGLVEVSIEYSSPDVHAPDGTDRRGKIWGELVPWGGSDLGYGPCGKECPWRGGANENTVFAVDHDVLVQGQPLPAGRYGLHFFPGPEQWTVVFSKHATGWGSYFYDPRQDALRVQATPRKNAYREWLAYDFTDRQLDRATVELQWEELALPIEIRVADMTGLYVENLRRELQTGAAFTHAAWLGAARFCLERKVNLPEAETWAERAVRDDFVGRRTFEALTLLADLQGANGKAEAAAKTMDEAIASSTAGPIEIHQYGRRLMREGKAKEALAVFQLNARRFPDQWPVHVGLARGYSGVGDLAKALVHARLALKQAPDEVNRKALEKAVQTLEGGKPWS